MSKQSAGGKARAAKLSKEDRSRIAREAARKRWGKSPIESPEPVRGLAHIYGLGPSPKGPLKIGYSTWVEARHLTMQEGNPLQLHVWFAIEISLEDELNARHAERKVHHMLRERRLRGEWFDIDSDTAEQAARVAVEEIKAGHRAPEHDDGSTVLLYFPEDLRRRMDARAKRDGVKLSDLLAKVFEVAGSESVEPAPTAPPSRLNTDMVPVAGSFPTAPLQKSASKRRWGA